MDFVIELLVQLIVQIVVEFLFDVVLRGAFVGLKRKLTTASGRRVFTAVVAAGFGVAWGAHLAAHPHLPRLVWVSLVLAAVAIALTARRHRPGEPVRDGFWRRSLTWPWRWPTARLVDFALLNAALAAGTTVGYSVG